jgi:hypothetical protein
MSTPSPISMANAGTHMQFPPSDDVQDGSSVNAEIAKAQRLFGEHDKQSIDEMNASLKSWCANRQRKEVAAYASAQAEKDAAAWRWATKLVGAGMSVAGACFAIYKTAQAGGAYKEAHRTDSEQRQQLKLLKAEGAEPHVIQAARSDVHDLKSEVDAFDHLGRKAQSRADTAQMFDRAAGGVAAAVGECGSAGDETKKKFKDVEASLCDSNAQLEMEISRRRGSDGTEARKRMDEINQSLGDIARKSASVFA